MHENKLKPNDAISMAFANYCYKHNKTPSIKHGIAPTITTKGDTVIVERG